MAQRTSTTYSQIEAQSFRPVFVQTIAFTNSATVFMLLPYTAQNGPGGQQDSLAGVLGARGSLLIFQSDVDVYIRLVGVGTVAAAQTVTYSADSGAQTIVLNGVTLSFSSGASATATALLAVAALRANRLLAPFIEANSSAGVVTFTAKSKGAGFNALTLSVTGTGATAGAATFASGVGPTAATAATNAILLPAKSLLPLYRFPADVQIDVLGTASGNLQVFAGY